MKKLFCIMLSLGLLSSIAFAQDFNRDKLDQYFEALEMNDKFMGSVAVSQDGKIIYAKSVGFSDVESNAKANEETKYRIGSISKTFTSTLILKGVELNKINLEQTIDQYFPSIENSSKITIKDLLYHKSGIHNFTNDADYLTYNTQAKSESQMIEIITKAGSDFEPGSKTEYSNSNYVLLTFILEKSLKKSYADLLTEYITKPIGLENTYLGGKIKIQNNESNSYRFMEKWNIETETDISIPLGAGGVVSTPTDLVKFSDALFAGRIIEEESLEQMKTINNNFGMGLFQIPFGDKIGFGHNGGIDGFVSTFCHFPDGNISYAMISNGTNYNTNNISIAVLSAIHDKPFSIPEFKTYEVSSEDLDKYLGVYASSQIPLKITITKDNKTLVGQATGQPAFPLEASEKDKFKFDQAGVVLEFQPADKAMTLIQGGGKYNFIKEE